MPRSTVITLGILVVTATVMLLNETSLVVALPAIMADYSIPATTAQWLLTGFMLTMAVVIPTTGYLIDRFSTRTLFNAATGLFLLGSLCGALAPVFAVLLLGRVIQAIGAAIIVPVLMTVTMTLVPPQRRGTVMGLISVVIAVGPALGPTFGGAVVSAYSWHMIFWSISPLLVLALLVAHRWLPNVGRATPRPLDLPSVALSAIGFGAVVYALSSVQQILDGGSAAVRTSVIGLIGVGVVALFCWRQLRLAPQERALLDLRPLSYRNFRLALIALLAAFGMLIGTVTVLPIYLQTALGASAVAAGMVVMPGGLIQGLSSPLIGRLFDAWGPRPLVIPGAIAMTVALVGLSRLGPEGQLWQVVAWHMCFAVALALLLTPLMTAALGSLPGTLYGHGSAIVNTLQQLAGAAGTALLVVILSQAAGSNPDPAIATATGASWAFGCAAAIAAIAVLVAPFITRPEGASEA